MDIEKTIQFLIENAAQHDARIAAAEKNAVTLGDALLRLTSVVETVTENLASFQEATERAAEESRKARDELRREMRERDTALDERIAKLVSAIAALASGRGSQPPA